MKNRVLVRVSDVYILIVFIYLAVAFFAKTTSVFSYLGYITVAVGVFTSLIGRFNRNKTVAVLSVGVLFNILYFFISSKVFEASINSPTTHGRFVGSSIVMLHLIFFCLIFSIKGEKVHTQFLYVLEVICLIMTIATYSFNDIYEGVLGHVRLGEKLNGGNLFGMLMALFGIFQFYRLVTFQKTRIFDIVLLFLDVVLVATSGSRKAFIGMFAGATLLVLLLSKSNKIITICKIILAAALLFYILSSLSITSGFFERFSTLWSDSNKLVSKSDQMRSELALFALNNALKRPVFGYGFNSYTTYSVFHTYAHNNYAELLFDTGVIGIILYYFPKFYIFINLVKANSIKTRPMTALYITIMGILFIYDIACVSYYDTLMNMFWWMSGAYLLHILNDKGRIEIAK